MISESQMKINVPWVLGEKVRVPRIKFPSIKKGLVSIPSPGKNLFLLVIYGLLFWLMAGGIYLTITEMQAVGQRQIGPNEYDTIWLYPSTHDAFIIESLAAASLIFLGGIGFIFLYMTTKNSYNYKYAIILLGIGIISIIISFTILQYMIKAKGGM